MNSMTKVPTQEKDKAESSVIPEGLKKPDYCPIVIDGDGHLMEHLTLWEERMKGGPYADRAPRAVPDRTGLRVLIDGKLFPKPMGPGLGRPNGIRHHWANGVHYDHINPDPKLRDQDAKTRLRDQTLLGIDAGVLIPSPGLQVCVASEDPDFMLACCEAFNDWLYEFCQDSDPKRHLGLAMLPLQDATYAAKELRRNVKRGFVGAWIRPNPVNGRGLDDPFYEPLWNEAVELDVPICTHEGTGSHLPAAGAEQFDNFFFTHSCSHSLQTMVAFAQIVAGGPMARHPKLRVAFLEAGCGWLPFWLDRLDEHFEIQSDWVPWLKKKPSDYYLDQGYISCEAEEPMIPYVVERFGSERMLFTSDYPHWDGETDPVADFFRIFGDTLSEEDQVNIMCNTSQKLYNLDLNFDGK